MEARFFRYLRFIGFGVKATTEAGGRRLYLRMGYTHEVELTVLPAVRVFCFKEDPRKVYKDKPAVRSYKICCAGIDKERTNQFAATLRSCKPPNAYTGFGILNADEVVKRKPMRKAEQSYRRR